MTKFWKWAPANEATQQPRTLLLEGYIAQESWFDDDVTPAAFKADLDAGSGDITVRINSPGGDCFAAAQIHNMLKEYSGKVTVFVDALAASAASVIAMAGDEVIMSPLGMLMIHNPSTIAWGDEGDMDAAKGLLREVKESIINAYEGKTKLGRAKLAHLMDAETWMSAGKAVEMGFADSIAYQQQGAEPVDGFMFDQVSVTNSLAARVHNRQMRADPVKAPDGVPANQLYRRLDLIKE